MQVLHELLKHDPEGAGLCDDKGHLPLELAADRSYDHPSPVMDVVVQMLTNPDQGGQLFNNKVEGGHTEADSGAWALPHLLFGTAPLIAWRCPDVCLAQPQRVDCGPPVSAWLGALMCVWHCPSVSLAGAQLCLVLPQTCLAI